MWLGVCLSTEIQRVCMCVCLLWVGVCQCYHCHTIMSTPTSHTHRHTHLLTHHTHTFTRLHTSHITHTHTHTHTHTYTHTHTHTHVHTHTHTQTHTITHITHKHTHTHGHLHTHLKIRFTNTFFPHLHFPIVLAGRNFLKRKGKFYIKARPAWGEFLKIISDYFPFLALETNWTKKNQKELWKFTYPPPPTPHPKVILFNCSRDGRAF